MQKIKRMALIPLMLAIMGLLGGCGRSMQVENQAYAIVMGLDREADGQMRMNVLIPKIAGNSEEIESASKGGNSNSYTRIEVRAQDFESALERLNWAAPRSLNLAQLKLIVLSRSLAEEKDDEQLLTNIAQTERLFTAVRVAVCEDSACDFVAAIQPTIGMRLSTDIDAMFDHYTRQGFIPTGCLAELYYQTESVYSDPMAIYALLDASAEEQAAGEDAAAAFAFDAPIDEISASNSSEIATRYLGASVFSEGRLCGVFDARQTVFANLLRNSVDNFHYACSGQSIHIVPTRAVIVNIDTSSEPIRIRVNLHLSIAAQDKTPDMETLEESLRADIEDVFHAAQRMNAEPFGFAEKAAVHFSTLDDWVAFDWHSRFRNAQLELIFHFARTDA